MSTKFTTSQQTPNDLPPLSDLALRTTAMPKDTNANGDMFGGWILSQMDMAGGIVAAQYARNRIATVAIEAMTFLTPVFVGDEVSCYVHILKVGRTSLTLKVQAWARSRYGEDVRKVTEGVFTFVAIDSNRRPTPLPQHS
jgi:acyl-CoA thioesterase YciA